MRCRHSIPALAAALQLLVPIALARVYELSTRDDDLQLSRQYVLEKRGSFKRIVRIEIVGGNEHRNEAVPIQVRSFEKRGDFIFVRQVRAEGSGESGIITHEQEISFWVIKVSEGRQFGPFSEADLIAAYQLEPESPVLRRTIER